MKVLLMIWAGLALVAIPLLLVLIKRAPLMPEWMETSPPELVPPQEPLPKA